jgi:multidrug efflux pump subunit AcrA (membrane-fusion protein)
VTSPTPDLSKLRINRDAPPPALRRALRRNVALGLGALALVLGGVFALRRGGAVPVQVVTASPISGSEGGGAGAGAASVTANGYVVARTRASVSAKLPGRIADLRVSEGSTLK